MEKDQQKHLYVLYFDTVYRVCFLYMKNPADAQDMTQETFYQMLQAPFQYESDEKTKAWLIVTASNLCKNQLKKWWTRKTVPFEECIGETKEDKQDSELYCTVMSMEEKYKIPTYLYYYEGYTTAEISKILNVKQSTIQTRLAKARELLRLELE